MRSKSFGVFLVFVLNFGTAWSQNGGTITSMARQINTSRKRLCRRSKRYFQSSKFQRRKFYRKLYLISIDLIKCFSQKGKKAIRASDLQSISRENISILKHTHSLTIALTFPAGIPPLKLTVWRTIEFSGGWIGELWSEQLRGEQSFRRCLLILNILFDDIYGRAPRW